MNAYQAAADINQYCQDKIVAHAVLNGCSLLRIYFHHAPPSSATISNPIDRSSIKLGQSPIFAQHSGLIDKLELMEDFAVRLGETINHGWKRGVSALRALSKRTRVLEARDLVPSLSQKGVDLRIGLDISRLALKELVNHGGGNRRQRPGSSVQVCPP